MLIRQNTVNSLDDAQATSKPTFTIPKPKVCFRKDCEQTPRHFETAVMQMGFSIDAMASSPTVKRQTSFVDLSSIICSVQVMFQSHVSGVSGLEEVSLAHQPCALATEDGLKVLHENVG